MRLLNDKRSSLWTAIVALISLKQLTATMGDDFRTYVAKAEQVKRVSKSKQVHALANQLLAEQARISRTYVYFQGIPLERTTLVETLIHAHVVAVQEYDHEEAEDIENYLFDLKYAPTREELGA
jgi:hypothetical protein